MFTSVKIAPSILSADFMNFGRDIAELEQGGADWLHVDVMDGHFVPNLTFGVPFVAQAKRATSLPLDVHLMISNPLIQVPWYIEAGADSITVHIEAFDTPEEVGRVLQMIRDAGVSVALALKPDCHIERLRPFIAELDMVLVMSVFPGFSGQAYIEGSEHRVAEVAAMAQQYNPHVLIQVDGGISASRTAGLVAQYGADVLVAGSGVFKASDRAQAIQDIRIAATKAQTIL